MKKVIKIKGDRPDPSLRFIDPLDEIPKEILDEYFKITFPELYKLGLRRPTKIKGIKPEIS